MTPQEWIDKYGRLTESIRTERVLFFATTATMATMQERIWGRGELTDGSKLTYKEDYQVYGYKPPLAKKPSGKGKTGKPIKGGWAPTYLALKEQQGRRELPFELTGALRQAWLGGVTATPREKDPLLCVIDLPGDIAVRAEGLARQKGEYLELSTEERAQHVVNVELTYRERVLGQ